MDNTQQNLATKLYINENDITSSSIEKFMETIYAVTSTIKGYVRITNKIDSSQFILYEISDLTDNGSWWTININSQSYSTISPFENNEDILASFITSGNKGDTGAQGAQGIVGNQQQQQCATEYTNETVNTIN